MPFTFNASDLYIVTLNGRAWMCVRNWSTAKGLHMSKKIAQKYQISDATSADTPVGWSKDWLMYDIHINEKAEYKLLFSSQQTTEKDFKRHYCNVLSPHVQQ